MKPVDNEVAYASGYPYIQYRYLLKVINTNSELYVEDAGKYSLHLHLVHEHPEEGRQGC